jgi:hypothetical protein
MSSWGVTCLFHDTLTPVTIQNQINTNHILQTYFPNIRFNLTHLLLGLPSSLFPSGFSNQNFVRI